MNPNNGGMERSQEIAKTTQNSRVVDGNMTQEEADYFWTHPEESLFTHEITRIREGKETKTKFDLMVLSDQNFEAFLQNIRDSWGEDDFEDLKEVLADFLERRRKGEPGQYFQEYYLAMDSETQEPFAITGIYSNDVQGGTGLGTKNVLDPKEHSLSIGLGWFAVAKKYQGTGIGSFLLNWTENLARSRGAKHMFIETDTWENEGRALQMYLSRGYKLGFSTPNYFGPNRDLETYYSDISDRKNDSSKQAESFETIEDNIDEVMDLAKKIYSPLRFEEFRVCIEAAGKLGDDGSRYFKTLVLKDTEGKLEGFGVCDFLEKENAILVYWPGARPNDKIVQERVLRVFEQIAQSLGKQIVIIIGEGQHPEYEEAGYKKPDKKGISKVYGKDDETELLLLIKQLN